MRTTMNLDDDILIAARSLAHRARRSIGSVISELARRGLQHDGQSDRAGETETLHGFAPLPHRGRPVTNELINELREDGPY